MSEVLDRSDGAASGPAKLKRSLSLPLMVLYGLGVTIGAGIYVLVGATAGVAGVYAPVSFLLAALVMLPAACSFAELVGRYPVSAGEAAYVRAGLNSQAWSVTVGLLVVAAGTVSAATICLGSIGYIRQFVDLPGTFLLPGVVVAMTLIAAWGVRESVTFAAAMTFIEIIGLLAVVAGGFFGASFATIAEAPPPPAGETLALIAFGVLSGGVLAFFAFIGFEDLVNMAEETHEPAKTMPKAIFLTLAISTLLYVLVSCIAILNVPVAELAAAEAPLSVVFERTTGASPATIGVIAIIATLNGVIIQIIMCSRVIYGLSAQGSVPAVLGYIHPLTRTPLLATGLIGATVLLLAALAPLAALAEWTSKITLTVFALVNLSLWLIKRRGDPVPPGTYVNPSWVPLVGLILCLVSLAVGFLG